MGYFYALLSSVFFTLYAVPKKFSKLNPVYYVLFMGLSCFLVSSLFYIFIGTKESLFDKVLLISFIGGISWFVASALFFFCVDKIGVARATEFKSLQGPFGSIMILTILSEYSSLNIYLLIIAIAFILLSSLMLVVEDGNNRKIKKSYLLLAVLSALLYGLSGFFRKVVTLKGFVHSQQLYSSLGIIVGSVIYILFNEKKIMLKKENTIKYSLAMASGLFYYIASLFMLLSYKYIEGSVAFSIIQLNALWAGVIGIFLFKEIDYRKYSKNIFLAFIFALMGIGILFIC